MKNFIIIFIILCSRTLNAQSIHTLYIDSTHITSNWPTPPLPCPSDTSFSISNEDTLYFINKLSNTMFNVWINDPNFTGGPTYGTGVIPTNDTITRIAVVNNSTYHVLGDNNIFFGSYSQLPNICLLKGTAEYGRRYFINHTVGIDDLKNANLLIYPSPAKDIINIKGISEKETTFIVFDLSGKKMIAGVVTSSEINIQQLSTGTYILQLSIESVNMVYKFIKQ